MIFSSFFNKKRLPAHLKTGIFGEKKAARFLRARGYKIIKRNFSSYGKEIDIIAQNKDFFVFCEVKSRKTNEKMIKKYGRPADAVNYYKKKNLIAGAKIYLATHKVSKEIRFDVIEVFLSETKKGKLCLDEIHHIKDAFRA